MKKALAILAAKPKAVDHPNVVTERPAKRPRERLESSIWLPDDALSALKKRFWGSFALGHC